MGAGDSLCDGGEGRIGFAIEPIAVVDYLDLVGPAIPLADEMGAGRNGPCGSAGAWCLVRHSSQSAGSLREGMEETLTVVKLALPESLRKSLATTNSIENLNGTIRRVSRNVKRWKSPSMIRRWTALGVVTAEKKFRRIKGYRHMGALVHALRSKQKSLDSDAFAA